ncbi:hypothetical protein RRG08_030740 [Elysia crispata]|uniref:Uncharacterized protein n=1 Tax=Elysia crispata TaxID=231223 RepID=A0AAE0Y4A8_9GAST|nr:hypothetical protein RRG08_030740 [Elysia crispata]
MESRSPTFLFIPANEKPKKFQMSHSQQPYAESVYAVHQRYEDTSLIIFNQLQKSLGKVAKAHSAAPLGGPVISAQGSQPPRRKSDIGRGFANIGSEATKNDRKMHAGEGNSPSSVLESQSPPQSKS